MRGCVCVNLEILYLAEKLHWVLNHSLCFNFPFKTEKQITSCYTRSVVELKVSSVSPEPPGFQGQLRSWASFSLGSRFLDKKWETEHKYELWRFVSISANWDIYLFPELFVFTWQSITCALYTFFPSLILQLAPWSYPFFPGIIIFSGWWDFS